MADETQVIREQMEQTRASLADKLDTLEQQVVETVHEVTETVGQVQGAVHETVATVKNSVQETVISVKEAFDVERQVERHPWVMFGGAVAVGYLGKRLADRLALPPARPGEAVRRSAARPMAITPGDRLVHDVSLAPALQLAPVRLGSPSSTPHWHDRFQAELRQLEGLAIGTTLGIVRDALAHTAPAPLGRQLAEVMDSVTVKLGGKPLRGPILDSASRPEPEQATGNAPGRLARTDRPMAGFPG